MDKPYLYLAGPMFSDNEKCYNVNMSFELEEYFNIYLPQRDGGTMESHLKKGKDIDLAVEIMMEADLEALNRCDTILAVLEGPQVDDGTACEIGFVNALGKPCYGILTDPRKQQKFSINLFVGHCLAEIWCNMSEIKEWAIDFCAHFNHMGIDDYKEALLRSLE